MATKKTSSSVGPKRKDYDDLMRLTDWNRKRETWISDGESGGIKRPEDFESPVKPYDDRLDKYAKKDKRTEALHEAFYPQQGRGWGDYAPDWNDGRRLETDEEYGKRRRKEIRDERNETMSSRKPNIGNANARKKAEDTPARKLGRYQRQEQYTKARKASNSKAEIERVFDEEARKRKSK